VADRRSFPVLRQTVLDGPDARALAEFYRALLGLRYRPGDEPPAPGQPDPQGRDWLVLRGADPAGIPAGRAARAGNLAGLPAPADAAPRPHRPDGGRARPAARPRAAARRDLLLDRSADPEEPLRVYADPAGHPFCIFVAPDPAPA
jgi:hypothetical protein